MCTNYVAKLTGDQADNEASLKPNITLFLKNDPASLGREFDTATSFLHMELFVEVKQNAQYDSFRDLRNGGMVERDSNDGHDTRGECLLYAAN